MNLKSLFERNTRHCAKCKLWMSKNNIYLFTEAGLGIICFQDLNTRETWIFRFNSNFSFALLTQ